MDNGIQEWNDSGRGLKKELIIESGAAFYNRTLIIKNRAYRKPIALELMNFFKPIALAALSAFSSASFGQSKSPDVWTYHTETNAAEIFIMSNDHKKAIDLYELAFKSKPPEAKDLYNVYVLSFLLKDTTRATKYFNTLASYGLSKKAIEGSNFWQIHR